MSETRLPPTLEALKISLPRLPSKKSLLSILESPILVIGSGGIGCELLKNLSLTGFKSIDVIDLDTIDISNLNRQFLFRKRHVGQPKGTIACSAASSMSPHACKFTPHHKRVQEFSLPFFKKFACVLNALDNVEARRYVNRLCLSASVPLIEAGSTGYLGQVTSIDKRAGVECYECQPKPTPKVYPICTIRSTPSMPVHCIVWAKEFYKLLFAGEAGESMLFEEEIGGEVSTYMALVEQFRTRKSKEFKVEELLVALYQTEIEKQIGMDKYKNSKHPPSSIPPSLLSCKHSAQSEPSSKTSLFTTQQSIHLLYSSLSALLSDPNPPLEFCKDHQESLHFVTAAANLRATVFHIPIQSLHSTKGIAGNIIPAIATTNAIVAGLQVLQLFHILSSETPEEMGHRGRYTYCLRDKTRKGFYVLPTKLPKPSSNCFVCRNAKLEIKLADFGEWNLKDFLAKIVKKDLGFSQPTLLVGDGDVIWEEGEGADESFEKNLLKLLADLPAGGLKEGSAIRIEDFAQDLEVDGYFSKLPPKEKTEGEEDDKEEDGFRFQVQGEEPKVRKEQETNEEPEDGASNDDDLVVVEEPPASITNKREREGGMLDDGIQAKRIKQSKDDDNDDVVVIV